MHIKFTESETVFRNINGVDVSDDEWEKRLIVHKVCNEIVNKSKDIVWFRDKNGKEIKCHPLIDLLNK